MMSESENEVAVILASHGYFAQEALKSAEMIVGKQKNCATFSVTEEMSLKEARNQVFNIYNSLETKKGTVILVDILGGTPSNVSGALCLQTDNTVVLSGLNMPMLLDLFTNRTRSLKSIAKLLKNAYQLGFKNISDTLTEKRQDNNGSSFL